jgi:hypothetical protein
MLHPQRPLLRLEGSICENVKNFEVIFNDFYIQGDDKDLNKHPEDEALQEAYARIGNTEVSATR